VLGLVRSLRRYADLEQPVSDRVDQRRNDASMMLPETPTVDHVSPFPSLNSISTRVTA